MRERLDEPDALGRFQPYGFDFVRRLVHLRPPGAVGLDMIDDLIEELKWQVLDALPACPPDAAWASAMASVSMALRMPAPPDDEDDGRGPRGPRAPAPRPEPEVVA